MEFGVEVWAMITRRVRERRWSENGGERCREHENGGGARWRGTSPPIVAGDLGFIYSPNFSFDEQCLI